MNDSATRRLLDEALGGDGDAIGKLLERERDRLRRTIVLRMDQRIQARVDPSDILQESFAEAARQLPEYLHRPAVPFYVWLRQIVENRMIDFHRRHLIVQRRSVVREDLGGPALLFLDGLASTGINPEAEFSREEARRFVRDALARLSEADQELLIMRHFELLRLGEIAAILGITERAAKSRLRRALERLKQRLEHAAGGGDRHE